MLGDLNTLQRILLWLVPVIFAITIHEIAHGWVAKLFGDQTASQQNRLSLNPVRHIDPIGSLLVPGILLVFSSFIFGWAKPVPVVAQNLRHPKQDMILVAAAGPLSNFIMTLFWLTVIKFSLLLTGQWLMIGEILIYTGVAGVLINLVLMIVNLVPILPLDGGRVLAGFLPDKASRLWAQTEKFGLLIVLLLMFSGFFGAVLMPIIFSSMAFLSELFDIPADFMSFVLKKLVGF